MLTWILAGAAVICLAYFGVIAAYAGFGGGISIWLVLSVLLGAASFGVRYYQKYPDRVPMWLPVSLVTLCASGSLVLVTVLILMFGRIPQTAQPDLDYVIVLGAAVREDGVSNTLKLRLDKAAEYAAQNPDTILVLSGAKGPDEPCTEAFAMQQYLLKKGVPMENMLLEEQSASTLENIVYSRLLIEKQEDPPKSIGVLTSNFHLLRARLIAEHQGLGRVAGIAAESDRVLMVHNSLRDVLAILKDRLMGNL